MSQQLFPRPKRPRPDRSHRRWRVEYRDMAYEGGGGSSWDQFYRTRTGAFLSALLHQHVKSYGGVVTLVDQREERWS